jgi:ribosomal protein S27E
MNSVSVTSPTPTHATTLVYDRKASPFRPAHLYVDSGARCGRVLVDPVVFEGATTQVDCALCLRHR